MGGLADLMKDRGYGDSDVCNLFALHDASRSCPTFVAHRAWLPWLTDAAAVASLATATSPTSSPTGTVPVKKPPRLRRSLGGVAPAAAAAQVDEVATDPTCVACTAPVVLEGIQKIALRGAGKLEQYTAFALRLDDGEFTALDPLGQRLHGTWAESNADGSKLRLKLDAASVEALATMLGESAKDVDAGVAGIRMTGPAKITLRSPKGNAHAGEVAVRFKAEIDGRTRRGSYSAKLWVR